MAGRGVAPKPPGEKARRNADVTPLRVIVADPVAQPELPPLVVIEDGETVEKEWAQSTIEWWKMWGEEPISSTFRATDWAFLADTAILHSRFWQGDAGVAAELRLRVAKLGATLEDRARLRIVFAAADSAEGKKGATDPEKAKLRRAALRK